MGYRCHFINPSLLDVIAGFIDALGTLPAFRHLQLNIREDLIWSSPTSQVLSNLQTLNIQVSRQIENRQELTTKISALIASAPNLQVLSVGARTLHMGSSLTLREIFPSLDHPELRLKKLDIDHIYTTPNDIQANIRHFGQLERLSIMKNSWAKSSGAAHGSIWLTLHKNHIHLHALATDAIRGPGFVNYLTSFTGLRELIMIPRNLPDNSGEIAQVHVVIAHHRKTLEILNLGSKISWTSCSWLSGISGKPIIDAQRAVISQCENLRELAVICEFMMASSAEKAPSSNWDRLVSISLPFLPSWGAS